MDPGWRPALSAVIPFVGPFIPRCGPAIVRLRAVWLSFCVAVILISWVVTFFIDDTSEGTWAVVAVLVVGVLAAGGVFWAHRRPIAATEEQAAVGQFNQRFFLQVAFGEVPALVGFVAALTARDQVPAFVGGAISLGLFLIAAPTRRELERAGPTIRDAMCRDTR